MGENIRKMHNRAYGMASAIEMGMDTNTRNNNRRQIVVCQDGPDFYNDWTGQLLFHSPRPVGADLKRAQLAREDFLRYCESVGIEPVFE